MNIILDVGARNGESLEEFVRWPFDRIYAYEPMPAQYQNILDNLHDERITANAYGLSDHTGTMTMYGHDQWGEASVYPTKYDVDSSHTTLCRFVDIADELTLIPEGTIYLKLNCEGSEIPILDRLIDTGLINRIHAFRVEFDISRVVGHEHEADRILGRLADINYTRYHIGSDARIVGNTLQDRVPQEGTHHERLHAWLESVWRP